jgi:hypothetical protein
VPDKINLLRRVTNLETAPQFQPYSKIIIDIDDDNQITVGDDTGRTLEYTDPFGTKSQAERQLAALKGFQYQPYYADGALLTPAAEIGDGVSINNTYGGLYNRTREFNRLMKANIAAPHDEEINHEYKFESPTERKFKREVGDVRASLLIQTNLIQAEVAERKAADESLTATLTLQSEAIEAKVSQTGGDNSSFGWSLLANEFGLYAGSKKVFKATADGVEIDGKVTARSGYIGNESNGFTITASAIYNSLSKFGGTQAKGVYIGTDGIQLGQNFKVDSAGNLTAASGTFSGAVRAGSIQYGGDNGTFNGAGITGNTIDTNQLSSYVNGGVGGGVGYKTAIAGNSFSSGLNCKFLSASSGISSHGLMYAIGGISISGHRAYWDQITVNGMVHNILTY